MIEIKDKIKEDKFDEKGRRIIAENVKIIFNGTVEAFDNG